MHIRGHTHFTGQENEVASKQPPLFPSLDVSQNKRTPVNSHMDSLSRARFPSIQQPFNTDTNSQSSLQASCRQRTQTLRTARSCCQLAAETQKSKILQVLFPKGIRAKTQSDSRWNRAALLDRRSLKKCPFLYRNNDFLKITKSGLAVGNVEIPKSTEEKIKLLINATTKRQLRLCLTFSSSLFSIYMHIFL